MIESPISGAAPPGSIGRLEEPEILSALSLDKLRLP